MPDGIKNTERDTDSESAESLGGWLLLEDKDFRNSEVERDGDISPLPNVLLPSELPEPCPVPMMRLTVPFRYKVKIILTVNS